VVGREQALGTNCNAGSAGRCADNVKSFSSLVKPVSEKLPSLTRSHERFLATVVFVSGRGQCLEQYGTGEAYLPVLEAIGRLCRNDQQVTNIVRTHAPMWLLQMPSL
jgi:hypothetical protein